jgi:hypothetical protein
MSKVNEASKTATKEEAAACEMVLLAVPWDNVPETLAIREPEPVECLSHVVENRLRVAVFLQNWRASIIPLLAVNKDHGSSRSVSIFHNESIFLRRDPYPEDSVAFVLSHSTTLQTITIRLFASQRDAGTRQGGEQCRGPLGNT